MKHTLVVFLLALAGAAMADPGDPPSRVARLNFIRGPVSFRPGSVDEWTNATPNYPLTTGDRLWADEGASAEIHIGSTAIRMTSRTALEFLNLDDRTAQLSLSDGSLNVRLRRLDDDQIFEVDTPGGAVSFLRPGDYRVDVNPDSQLLFVTVRGGQAEVTGAGSPFMVRPREMARIAGGGNAPSYEILAARPPDGWDEWCFDRDRREEQAVSSRYVSREMIGYEDLDAYGEWRPYPEYGMVWVPRVAVGWTPYRFGHWVWISPWGWTWVDDAPWGFAPFHYGRWAYASRAWVWVPGAVVVRPVYAPALVAFVGGSHFGMSVAWFPLGPREVYRPGYRVSETYVRNVNITHVTNVTQITNVTNVTNVRYVNRGVAGAVTAVPQQAFVSARPVAHAAVAVPASAVASAEVVHTAPVAPRRESMVVRAADGARVSQPPARVVERQVVVRTAPPAAAGVRTNVRQAEAPAARPARIEAGPARVGPPPAAVARPNDRPARAVETPAAPRAARPETTPQARPEPRREERGEVRQEAQPQAQPQARPQPRREERREVRQETRPAAPPEPRREERREVRQETRSAAPPAARREERREERREARQESGGNQARPERARGKDRGREEERKQ